MNGGNVITSCNNQLVVRLAKLSDPKFRRSEGLFLCEGEKLTKRRARMPCVPEVPACA